MPRGHRGGSAPSVTRPLLRWAPSTGLSSSRPQTALTPSAYRHRASRAGRASSGNTWLSAGRRRGTYPSAAPSPCRAAKQFGRKTGACSPCSLWQKGGRWRARTCGRKRSRRRAAAWRAFTSPLPTFPSRRHGTKLSLSTQGRRSKASRGFKRRSPPAPYRRTPTGPPNST